MKNHNNHGKTATGCPYCRSANILPSEDDTAYRKTYRFLVILLSAMVIFAAIFTLLILTKLGLPLVILVLIIIFARGLNRPTKKDHPLQKIYICLDCNKRFKVPPS